MITVLCVKLCDISEWSNNQGDLVVSHVIPVVVVMQDNDNCRVSCVELITSVGVLRTA